MKKSFTRFALTTLFSSLILLSSSRNVQADELVDVMEIQIDNSQMVEAPTTTNDLLLVMQDNTNIECDEIDYSNVIPNQTPDSETLDALAMPVLPVEGQVDVLSLTPEQVMLNEAMLAQQQMQQAMIPLTPVATSATIVSEKNQKYAARVAGTDQWNDIIYSISTKNNIKPCFVKSIMVLESSGKIDAMSKGGGYIGLYQISKNFGFDKSLMLSDASYATGCAISVIQGKMNAAINAGKAPTVFEVARRYNGTKAYATKLSALYEELSGGSQDDLVTIW